MPRLSMVRDAGRTQLWPVPAVVVFAAVAAGVGLPWLDGRLDDELPSALTVYLFGGGASAARTVLSAIASSLITVTSLTFSLTVVTLQLASSQFSPRLLRTFTRDRFVHGTLALFLGTFSYALTVLRTVRTSGEDTSAFVPQISVTVAFLLALASVLTLVLFLAHLAREIRVETMLRRVHEDASDAVQDVVEGHSGEVWEAELPERPADAVVLRAPSSGFLVHVDDGVLLEAADDAAAVVVLDRLPGAFLVQGTPMGAYWSRSGDRVGEETRARLESSVAEAVVTGPERTPVQDVAFGLRQLTDVATKALSPGLNDPTTAIHAIGHSSALLHELSCHRLGPVVYRDEAAGLRIVLARPTFADLLELAVAAPRRYGRHDPDVLSRLGELLGELGVVTADPARRHAIVAQVARCERVVEAAEFDEADNKRLRELFHTVRRAVEGSARV